MTGILVAPIALPKISETTQRRFGTPAGRQRLTLPKLRRKYTSTTAYDFASIDRWGRVIARNSIGALGWEPGTPIAIREMDGLILVRGDAKGLSKITGQGNLLLSIAVIWRCGLDPGTRMLVVAEPAERRLVIHPPEALDDMVAKAHATILGGDAS